GVDAGGGMALNVNQVATMVLARCAPEMVEADVVQRGAGREAGDVAADTVVLSVGFHHHGHSVPADQRADPPLQVMVPGGADLLVGRDGKSQPRARRYR